MTQAENMPSGPNQQFQSRWQDSPHADPERYELNAGMQAAAGSTEWNVDDYHAMITALDSWTDHDFRKFAHYMTGFRPSMLAVFDRYRLAHKERYGE